MPNKRQTRRRNWSWVGVVFAILVVAAGIVGVLAVMEMNRGVETPEEADSGDASLDATGGDQVGTSGDAPDNAGSDGGSTGGGLEPEKGVNKDLPPTGSELGVWVISQNVDGGVLRIRVQIDQNISSGTCVLEIGDYRVSADVVFDPQSASCAGFDVPTTAYSGRDFTIKVTSGSAYGSVSGRLDD